MSSIAKKPKMIDYSDSEEEEGQILDQPEVIPEPIKYLPADQDILRRKIHKSLPTNQKPKSCHFCSNTPKYKCPKCQISTCSLKCCKQHKVDFSCDGVRDQTKFIDKKSYVERDFKRDIHFLEDLNRNFLACSGKVARFEAAQSIATDSKPKNTQNHVHQKKFQKFLKNKLNIEYLILPNFYEQHLKNTSRINNKSKKIFWTLKINNKYFQNLPGNSKLGEALKKCLAVTSKIVIENWSVGMFDLSGSAENRRKATNFKKFINLDITKTLNDNFKNKVILEVPDLRVIERHECFENSLPDSEDEDA